MNKDLLCTWLGLPKSAWPPDPWALVGLPRGQTDLATIEERVQDRMAKLRHYQLSYPEEATEGMNRLAEAFVTLMEACSKPPTPTPKPTSNGAPIAKDETSIIEKTKIDWRDEPPPVRQTKAAARPIEVRTPAVPMPADEGSLPLTPQVIVDAGDAETLVAKPFVAPTRPVRREIDIAHLSELAEDSDDATSNVGTIDAVIRRVEATRELLNAWEKVGKLLKTQKKTSARDTDNFAKRLGTIAEVMKSYPAFLGQPGKPGYRVVALAHLKIPLPIVRAMTAEQRDELLFDWQAGYQTLLLHRKYIRKLFQSMRHRTTVGLVFHAVRSFLNDHPRLSLLGIVTVLLLGLAMAIKLTW